MKRKSIFLAVVFGLSWLVFLGNESKAQAQSTSARNQSKTPLSFTNPLDTRVKGSTPPYLLPKQSPPVQNQPLNLRSLPGSEIRQASRENIIQARARQIYNDRMSRDPRVISVQTGPTATQYFLTYLRDQIWRESLEQARREVR